MATATIYSPLPDDSFRVLKIISANKDQIICELEHFSFDDGPEYTALSYSWGQPLTSATITCNGSTVAVTPHLLGALYHLHSFIPDGRFWVDALCINQQDDEERASHTRRMDSVYRSAEMVVVWLGEAKDDSDLAMEQIGPLSKKFELILEGGTPENSTYIKGWLGHDELASSDLPEKDDSIWSSLGYIYSQTWFTRLWVLQEVILAKKIIVAHGTKRTEWEPFVALGRSFSPAVLRSVIGNNPEKELILRRTLHDLRMSEIAISRGFRDVESFGVPALFNMARSRDVTVPVDKIYGMLGMIHPRIVSQIVVDYSEEARRDWWKAYIQYGKFQLTSEGMLSLLTMAPSKERPKELPSWCPNFNSPPKDPASLGHMLGYQAGFESIEERIMSRVIVIPNSNRLKFFGFRVDRIHNVAGSPEHCWNSKVTKGPSGIADQLLEYEARCLQLSQQIYNSHGVPEAHWRTLAADADMKGQSPLEPEVLEDYLLCKKVWTSHRDQTPVDLVDTLTSSERQRVLNFQSSIEGRKTHTFFSTHGGRVGLGPCDLQAGDVICVLYGGAPLFVLRFKNPTGDARNLDCVEEEEAELVGDAFIHGLMDLKSTPKEARGEDEYFTIE